MGIQGLLPVLKSITRPLHVSAFRGNRVAVDAYCWLHRGAYTCSRELCEGIPTDKYTVHERMSLCWRMLRHALASQPRQHALRCADMSPSAWRGSSCSAAAAWNPCLCLTAQTCRSRLMRRAHVAGAHAVTDLRAALILPAEFRLRCLSSFVTV